VITITLLIFFPFFFFLSFYLGINFMLLNYCSHQSRLQLFGFEELKVQGDGNCQVSFSLSVSF
jgi:hypothetical protein